LRSEGPARRLCLSRWRLRRGRNNSVVTDGSGCRRRARKTRKLGPVVAAVIAGLASGGSACATEILRCPRFDQGELPGPAPSAYPSALERVERISRAVKSTPHSVLFLGDSLTELWDGSVWEHYLAPRGGLNAGVSGDRTDNLLWRLERGNLAGPQPKAVVLLIGTNDLASGRSPTQTADGIRANLEILRQRFPETHILLLGLLPREEAPSAPLRIEVTRVNQLIRNCADNQHVFYAEIGDALLAGDGLLSAAISPDRLHFTAQGYALLAARLEPELDRLLNTERQPK
jgi:lysophospholipase L1-like esterase